MSHLQKCRECNMAFHTRHERRAHTRNVHYVEGYQ